MCKLIQLMAGEPAATLPRRLRDRPAVPHIQAVGHPYWGFLAWSQQVIRPNSNLMHWLEMFILFLQSSSLPDFKPVFPRWEKQAIHKVRVVIFRRTKLIIDFFCWIIGFLLIGATIKLGRGCCVTSIGSPHLPPFQAYHCQVYMWSHIALPI